MLFDAASGTEVAEEESQVPGPLGKQGAAAAAASAAAASAASTPTRDWAPAVEADPSGGRPSGKQQYPQYLQQQQQQQQVQQPAELQGEGQRLPPANVWVGFVGTPARTQQWERGSSVGSSRRGTPAQSPAGAGSRPRPAVTVA